MKLAIMTKSTFFVEEDKILSSLFDEGLDDLHLCKPGAEPIYSERLLTLLDEDCYGKIIVHGHFYLKDEYGLKGIHIGDAETPPPQGYRGHISRTCRSIDDLKDAKKKSNYVLLRDAFDNPTSNKKAAFTIEQLEDAARRGLIDKHVYAIGGIDIDTMHKAKSIGFGGVVVCSDLWNRFDILNGRDYGELIGHFERLRKAAS